MFARFPLAGLAGDCLVPINSRTLITAIMPTFNRGRYVRRAVELFLRQTWKNSELLILDDSPTFERLRYGPRVNHVHIDRRMSVGAKHNLGMDMAQGEVIAHLDDDDWFSPRRFMIQMEPMAIAGATVTGIPIRYILHGPRSEWFHFSTGSLSLMQRRQKPDQLNRLPFHDGTAMFNRSVLRGGIRYPDMTVGQKLFFLNDLFDAGEKVVPVPNLNLFVYLRHGANTWKFVEGRLLTKVAAPRWFPNSELIFHGGGAA